MRRWLMLSALLLAVAASCGDETGSDSGDGSGDGTGNGSNCEGCFIDGTCYGEGDGCDDGLYCTVDDVCSAGSCMGAIRFCSDGVDCNGVEACSEDDDACLLGETTCVPSEVCDVASDTCVSTCEGCVIADACYEDDDPNPVNGCEACDTEADAGGWSDNDGANCDDELFCNGADTCGVGECSVHVGDPCPDDGVWCNGTESCDEGADSCAHSGSTCTETQVCDEDGEQCCDAEIDTRCDEDGDVVWVDSCDREYEVLHDCDDTNGVCLAETVECACTAGWTGELCDRCLIYVDDDTGNDDDSGRTWEDALATVEAALDAAEPDGCEIWVAAGWYYPEDGDGRAATFRLRSGVDLYGGFAGTEVLRDERDMLTNRTLLSGDLGTEGDTSDNAYHVVTGADDAIIDGFNIEAGRADHPTVADDQCGGGMLNKGTSPMVSNNFFYLNEATRGGAVCNIVASPIFEICYIDSNRALPGNGSDDSGRGLNGGDGGGIYNEGGSPSFTSCSISGNVAGNGADGAGDDAGLGGRGGGVFNDGGSPTFTSSFITGNSGGNGGASEVGENGHGGDGGGVYSLDSTPVFDDCYFDSNAPGEAGQSGEAYPGQPGNGGAMYNNTSDAVVMGSNFYGNSTPGGAYGYGMGSNGGNGGAVYNLESDAVFVETWFTRNVAGNGSGAPSSAGAGGDGGAIYNHTSSPTIRSCWFLNNNAGEGAEGGGSGSRGGDGGAVYNQSSSPLVINSSFNRNFAGRGGSGMSGGAGGAGGAICSAGTSAPIVINSIFTDNNAGDGESGMGGGSGGDGGAISSQGDEGTAVVANCSFLDNRAGEGGTGRYGSQAPGGAGGAVHVGDTTSTITNSILWANTPDQIGGTPTVTYSDIEGGFDGAGNIYAQPMFLERDELYRRFDLHLKPGSPCIDVGSTAALPADSADLDGDDDIAEPLPSDYDGRDRVLDTSVDMGAFELGELTEGALAVSSGSGVGTTTVVVFDDFLDPTSVDAPASFTFDPVVAVAAAAIGADKRSVDLTMGEPLDWCTKYTVTVTDAVDHWGNTLGDENSTEFWAGIVRAWDNFDDGDTDAWTPVDLGDTAAPSNWWVDYQGRLVQSSSISSSGAGADMTGRGGTIAIWNDPEALVWEDYRVQVKMDSTSGGDVGVVFRYTDANNYYKLIMNQTEFLRALIRVRDGVEEIIASEAAGYPFYSHGDLQPIELIVLDDTITIMAGGEFALFGGPVVDPTPLAMGTAGVFVNGNTSAWFDDFSCNLECNWDE